MPTFRGVLAFDPADAIPLGMIPKFEPISQEDEPRGYYTTNENSGTYEAYSGRRFPVTNFIYTSNPLDLEEAEVDENTGVLSKRFNFTLEFVWYRDEFFEVSTIRSSISIIAVGRDEDKGSNTDSILYVNANRSEEISIQFRPRFPVVSEQQAQSIIGYYVDILLSPSARRLLPANILRVRSVVSGSVQGSAIDFSGYTLDQFLISFDITSDPAFFASGITFIPFLKTGFQIANASTTFNNQVTISKSDIENAIVFNDCLGVAVSLGAGVGKVVCVTRDPLEAPGYQKRRVGYGVTIPWGGYWTGGIDGQYVVDARPLHYSLQFESAVEDEFMGALNAPVIRYGGVTESDLFYNCPRFSYTRIKNNFIIVYIPKAEAVEGFSFYISAHVAEDVSFYAMRTDAITIIDQVGIIRGSGSFVFTPQPGYVNSKIYIKNWIKKRTINSSLLESDPLNDIPAFSSSVVSEYAKPLEFQDAAIVDRSIPVATNVPVSASNIMRLSKSRFQAKLPRLQRFPLGYFAAADFFATNFDGDQKISGGIAYVDKNGNVDIILPKEQIRDKGWFNLYFGGLTINPIVEQEYYLNTGNDGGYVYLFYDVSPICNSLYGDNEKVPYDHRFAKAIAEVSSFNQDNANSGIGICQLNFLLKRSTGAWTVREDSMVKSPPPANNQLLNNYYYDLSNAKFDLSSPMPNPLQVEIRNPSVGIRTQGGFIPATITAFLEWSVLAPVSLKSNGRIYFQTTEPVSYSTGGSNSELNVPYVLTNPTSGKISTCLDYHGVNGALVSVGSFGGADVRSLYINGLLDGQRRKSYVKDINFPSLDVRTDLPDVTRPSWYGKSIDSIPLLPNGALVLRKKEAKSTSADNPPLRGAALSVRGSYGRRNVSFNNYQRGSWSMASRSEGFISFPISDNILVESGRVVMRGKFNADIDPSNNFINMAFSSSSSLFGADAMLFNNININDQDITLDFKVPYYGGGMTLFGGVLDFFEVYEASAILYVVDKSAIEKYKIDALDAAVAITAGGRYVAALAVSNPGGASVDLLVKEDENFMWKQIKNAVQSFAGESFSAVMIRSAYNSNKLFVSFVLQDCMFIKPIENEWLEDAGNNYTSPVKNRFSLPDGTLYGLSGEKYGQIFNNNDVRSSFLQNRIRISPGYLVYGANQDFIKEEKDHFDNALRFSTSVKSGDELSSRFYIGNEYASGDSSIKNLYNQSAVESYSFEVLPDGMLLFASIKDGGVILRLSNNDGITWRSAFSHFPSGVAYRPLKFLKTDRGSFTRKSDDRFTYFNGECPSVDSISTALDLYGQRVAFCYSIRSMLFLQEIPISAFTLDCDKDFNRMFTTDQREDVVYGVSVLPSLIAGILPNEYEVPLINGQCDFTWRIDGPISRNNVSGLGNIPLGGKAPSMIYLSNGALRLHFEGDRGEIRALTVTASTVRGDHIP